PAAECGVEPARQHDREQRRCDVRPVVDVLVLSAAFTATASSHSDWMDVEENGRRARFLARLRVEDCRVTERELARVHMVRMLVQQESEIECRVMSRSNRQEHVLCRRDSDSPVYRVVRAEAIV